MKLVKTADKQMLRISRDEWEAIGTKQGWIEAKKKNQYNHSPTEHGFIEECIEKNKDKDNPGAYCASIVDKAKGTTEWRKGPKD